MKMRLLTTTVAVALILGAAAFAQDEGEIIFEQDFEQDADGLTPMAPGLQHVRTNAEGEAHEGEWALKLTYAGGAVDEANFPAVVVQGLTGEVGGVRVSLRASHRRAVACMLQERTGARYASFATVPAGEWVTLGFGPWDFVLDDQTPDANNQLDGDQIDTVGIADVTDLLAREMGLQAFMNLGDAGQQLTLCIDDLTIASKALGDVERGPNYLVVDDFNSGALRGIFVGDGAADVTRVDDDDPEGEKALMLRYTTSQQVPIAAIMRTVPDLGDLVPTTVQLDAKAEFPGAFMVGAMEADGSEYYTQLTEPLTDEWNTIQVALNTLNLGDDSTDENGRLDGDQIRALVVGDISGILQQEGINTLYVDNLILLKPE